MYILLFRENFTERRTLLEELQQLRSIRKKVDAEQYILYIVHHIINESITRTQQRRRNTVDSY